MLFAYKKLNVLAAISAIVLGIAVGWMKFPNRNDAVYLDGLFGLPAARSYTADFIGFVLCVFVVELVVVLVFETIAQTRYRKVFRLICEEADPHRFLVAMAPIMERAEKHNKRRFTTPSALLAAANYAQGLFEVGETNRAVEILEGLLSHKSTWTKPASSVRAGIFMLLHKHYRFQNNPDAMVRCTTEIKNACANYGKGWQRKALELCRKKAAAMNALHQGKYNEALEYYLFALKKSKTNLERIRSHCYLAEIYAALDVKCLSEAHLLIALEQAPELFSVAETRRRLCPVYESADDNL